MASGSWPRPTPPPRRCSKAWTCLTGEEAIAIRITDRPGALGKVTRKLADAGVNVDYAYGSIVKGEQRALVILGVSDLKKAEEVL